MPGPPLKEFELDAIAGELHRQAGHVPGPPLKVRPVAVAAGHHVGSGRARARPSIEGQMWYIEMCRQL